ncbi:LCP family protein [Vallitalea okinawensis]|uniref:LCP family protein n=1 Tax=Vallitalea okinawensis TaxID=2078660 RepID=UPI000CFE303D|nr:LCP family protein [Vallitalea okinawensis]
MKKFGIIFIVIVAVTSIAFIWSHQESNENPPSKQPIIVEEKVVEEEVVYEQNNDPLYITGAIIGKDASGGLTDVMMVGVFNTETYNIDVFAIPRDTKITVSDELHNRINEGLWAPQTMKLTDLYWRVKGAGLEDPILYTIDAMEQIVGIPIDHYVTVDTDSFDQVIDALGGIDLYVPMDMNYEDPFQNLYIHLKEGYQHLNGAQAEQLVRYRSSYSDLARIEIQQYLIQSCAEALLNINSIKQVEQLLRVVYDIVETDIGILDAISYLKYYEHLDLNRIDFYTIPGITDKIDGIWYFIYTDETTVYEFVHQRLSDDNSFVSDSKDSVITILNGTGKTGLATKYRDILTEKGYHIGGLDNSNGSFHQKTQIIVKEEGMGYDLRSYFTLSEVIVAPEQIPEGSDIVIILGGLEE